MGLGESLQATTRVLLDSPEILRELKDLSDDQQALKLAFTDAISDSGVKSAISTRAERSYANSLNDSNPRSTPCACVSYRCTDR